MCGVPRPGPAWPGAWSEAGVPEWLADSENAGCGFDELGWVRAKDVFEDRFDVFEAFDSFDGVAREVDQVGGFAGSNGADTGLSVHQRWRR